MVSKSLKQDVRVALQRAAVNTPNICFFIFEIVLDGLEIEIQAQGVGARTRINFAVDTGVDFGVDAGVTGEGAEV
jgi:hypothetical protein